MSRTFFRQAIQFIPASRHRRAYVLILSVVAGSLLDVFSLASFIPLIVFAISPGQTGISSVISGIQSFTGLSDPLHFGMIITLFAIFLTILKTQINIWITFHKASYAYEVSGDLASRAMTSFFQTPFRNYPAMDYTKEMNRISSLPLIFANNFIIPFGTIISETLILLVLISIIAIYNFSLFVFLVLIISPVALIYSMKRKKIKEISQRINSTYPFLLKYTLQAIEAFPEIRIFRKESFFRNRFRKTYDDLGKTFAADHTSHTGAARTTEIVAAIGIGVLVIYVLLNKQSSQESVLLLTLYAATSFRMMPSINRVFSAFLQIRTHEYVVTELGEMLDRDREVYEESETSLPFADTIELKNISFSYAGQVQVLRNISLNIRKGERIILTGRSGGGKTTLLMILLRFLDDYQGDILVDGVKLNSSNTFAWRKLLGYIPQNPYILDASILENVGFGLTPEKIDLEKVSGILRDLDLENWINALPMGLRTIIGEKGAKISGGQRQRLAIARSLYYDAEILLLDEITNQLDAGTELEVMRALKKLGKQEKTILLITHHPELWTFADSIYELKSEGVFKRTVTNTTNQFAE